ncbi:MAG: DUF3343 domain-containing protein [Syntrophales bacterium]|nr:DUF3343 domain-containing protein [Syntrophales bacterium]
MIKKELYEVALFEPLSHAMRAEKILKEAGVPCKLIPIPRHISSDCGACLKFAPNFRKQIEEALAGIVKLDIHNVC